jgi:hypothetical protein
MAMNPKHRVASHKHTRDDFIDGYSFTSQGRVGNSNVDLSKYCQQDIYGYISVAGVHFGSGWGDIYRQTVSGNPAYTGTVNVLEISGQGLIIDGCLNVSGISMNSSMTGFSGLVLDNSDGKNGFIQWGNTLATTARLAQVILSGHSEQVLAVQAWVGTGGKFNSGVWDLGALDVSLLFVDHITSASAGGVYMFDDLRLYGPSSGHKLYDSANASGTDSQVLTIDPTSHLPKWTSQGALNVSQINTDHINSSTGGDVYIFKNLRLYYSSYNFFPYANNDGNLGGNGAGTNYYWGSVWANYLKYHTSNTAFDSLDDLALVKNYKTKTETITNTVTKESVDVEVVDIENSLPHLLDEDGFRDPARDVGFLLGCAKFSALKIDELEAKITDLEAKLAKLTPTTPVNSKLGSIEGPS